MQGFIFALFEQKWQRFGWYVHYAMCVLDAAVVYLNFHALVAIKAETEEEKDMHPNAHSAPARRTY